MVRKNKLPNDHQSLNDVISSNAGVGMFFTVPGI
jgi:hypothetical protein